MSDSAKIFENEIVKIWIENDLFLFGEYKVKVLDLNAAKKALDLRLEATGNKAYYTCATVANMQKFTKEARDFMSQPEAYKNIKAFAGVNTNPITRMIAKFYLTVKKPPIPSKLVANIEEAKNWFIALEKQNT